MPLLVLAGVILFLLGVLSRLGSLWLLRRISASPTRPVEPSLLPGTPWFHVSSDAAALNVIVKLTYGALAIGMLVTVIGLLI